MNRVQEHFSSQSDLKKLVLQWAMSDIKYVLFEEMLHANLDIGQRPKEELPIGKLTREKIQKAINNYMPEGTIPEWFDETFDGDFQGTSHRVPTSSALAILKDAKGVHYRSAYRRHVWQIGALRPDGSHITLDDKEKLLENFTEIYNNGIEKEAANKITKAAHKKLARMAEPGGSSYLDAMQRFRYRQHQQRKEMVKKKQKKRKNKKKRIVDVSPRIVLHEYPYHNVNSAPSVGLVNWNPRAVPGKAHIGGKIRKNKKKGGSKCGCRTRKGGFFGRFKKKVNTKKKGYSGGKRSAGRRKTKRKRRKRKRRKTKRR
jgi:hypothetical protein